MKQTVFFIVGLSLSLGTAWSDDIYRCPGANGSVVYQANPCKGGSYRGRSDEGRTAASPTTPVETQQPSDMERTKAYLAERERQHKKDELQDKKTNLQARIAHNDEMIRANQIAMDAEISALRAKKQFANNNLAGATWEQSISTEMGAITARYRTAIDSKIEENKRLNDELGRL